WYNFLLGQQADGTGMEIVGGNIVLHLKDGGVGDDDLTMNGIIFDIGGPATSSGVIPTTTTTIVASDHSSGSTYGQDIYFTATVSAASGTPTGVVQVKVDGQNVGSPVALTGGAASMDISSLSAIDHAIEALYMSNDAAFRDSDDDFLQHVDPA